MLVDLGRNDLGRVAETGSVQVTTYMVVERYTHVMHMVSQRPRRPQAGPGRLRLLAATFPAGTLTGAPKIRAMEIIPELEAEPRGVYGGAVGYVSFSGNMDMAITIRTACIMDGKLSVRAGAGIVADSAPSANARRPSARRGRCKKPWNSSPRNPPPKGGPTMLVMIDNFDSFTYNLFQYLMQLGAKIRVARNNSLTVAELEDLAPRGLVISPGPGRPEDAGITVAAIRHFSGRIPILGVCLGHQAIALAFGAKVVPPGALMHGKTSSVTADGRSLFQGIQSPFQAMRYHSLAVAREGLPEGLEVSAEVRGRGDHGTPPPQPPHRGPPVPPGVHHDHRRQAPAQKFSQNDPSADSGLRADHEPERKRACSGIHLQKIIGRKNLSESEMSEIDRGDFFRQALQRPDRRVHGGTRHQGRNLRGAGRGGARHAPQGRAHPGLSLRGGGHLRHGRRRQRARSTSPPPRPSWWPAAG